MENEVNNQESVTEPQPEAGAETGAPKKSKKVWWIVGIIVVVVLVILGIVLF